MMLIVIKLWLYHIIFTRGRLCTPISPTQKWLYFIFDLKNVINVLQQQNGWANRTLSSECVCTHIYVYSYPNIYFCAYYYIQAVYTR